MTNREIFDIVLKIGQVMLANGGEVSRTQSTLEIVSKAYNIREFTTYILSNGIFMTGLMGDGEHFCTKVVSVPLSPPKLCRVEAVNNLSREIVRGEVTPEQAKIRLEQIEELNEYSPLNVVLAVGVGSACMGYIMGGTIYDGIMVFFVGIILQLFSGLLEKNPFFPKIVRTIASSALVSIICCFFISIGLGSSLDGMIIGSIMPLVPGIALTNAVRYFFDNDYLSGVVRLVDAFLTALSIAVGVGTVIAVYNFILGGIII